MKISTQKPGPSRIRNLVVFVRNGEIQGPWRRIDDGLQKKFALHARREGFEAKPGQAVIFYPESRIERVIAVGVGEGLDPLRRAAAAAISRARAVKATDLHVLLPDGGPAFERARAATEGILLGDYRFDRYKSKREDRLGRLTLLGDRTEDLARGGRLGQVYADATALARDLVNEPAAVMTPRKLAEAARRACRGLIVRVYDEKWIGRKGMHALRAVSLGSREPPRFVHIRYRARGARKTLAIVGKAITFDSGGLCIKSAEGMMEMKGDMAGAAAVVGVMSALSRLKPRVNVDGIFGATENMPGGGAYKMRDVIRAMNGKTMEITNTDAEGRVTLADALSYASSLRPGAIIDLATLTGAAVVALGPKYSALFSANEDLVKRLTDAAEAAGEHLWRLPLDDEYFEQYMKSAVADMKNSGGRWGGAILGALFCKQYVDPKIPWAHLDIAGPAMFGTGKDGAPPAASGVMTRTLLRFLEATR